jgi:hypothetical protein
MKKIYRAEYRPHRQTELGEEYPLNERTGGEYFGRLSSGEFTEARALIKKRYSPVMNIGDAYSYLVGQTFIGIRGPNCLEDRGEFFDSSQIVLASADLHSLRRMTKSLGLPFKTKRAKRR